MTRPYGGEARREEHRSLGALASAESARHFFNSTETAAARRDPCAETAPNGRYSYTCARPAGHGGSHFDATYDSWWGRNAAGRLRVFPRHPEER